jgi:hypothetical protein
MQDSNPLNLFTRQALWPVELIRQKCQCGTPGGNRTRDHHVISVPHLPSVLPARGIVPAAGLEPTWSRPRKPALCPLSYAGCIWNPWRESNSHPQLRKLSLYPLSYRGMACAPLAGFEPATAGPGNRYAIRCATRALGRSDGIEPSTADSHATMLPLHHDHHAKCAGVAEAEGVEPPTACHAAAR